MLCKIADLLVEVPAAGDLISRCQDYLSDSNENKIGADIIIRTNRFREDIWEGLTGNDCIYLESGAHFQGQLLKYDGLVLHSSAVVLDGKAYLFSAPSGTGKSTHTGLWKQVFGEGVRIINDDKPALRLIDGTWYAYGTPWCGKDGININMKAPVAGICFLKQAPENRIRRLNQQESVHRLLWQTVHQFKKQKTMDKSLSLIESLIKKIPVYELENRPEPEAARLSYETMRRGAEELGL